MILKDMEKSQLINNRNLPTLSISHLLVDGICASVVVGQSYEIWLLYGICAFATQCFMGMLPDRYGGRKLTILSAVMLLGALVPLPIAIKTVIIGLGNSLFHVSGGYLCLKESDNMTPLGIFVAPGAIGLFLGAVFPIVRIPFAILLLVLSVIVAECDVAETEDCKMPEKEKVVLTILLLMAIAARAVGGSAIHYSWNYGMLTAGILTGFVFLGKTYGGIFGDRIGIRRIAIISIATAAVFAVFFSDVMTLSLIGQFALNLSMPVTLYLIYRLYPNSPGFAFGLAASALLPGTLLGNSIHFTGNMPILICFAVGLAAILIAERRFQ